MAARLSSGVEGLDIILKGGYLNKRTYLLKGGPGTGKSTLGLHFLEEGILNNEKCLFINVEQSKEELLTDAKSFDFSIDKIDILDLTPDGDYFKKEEDYDVFSPSEVEQIPMITKIRNKIKETKPDRLVFDGLSNIYYLYKSKYKLRKSIVSLIQFLAKFETTALFIIEDNNDFDNILQFIASGVINLEFDGYERKLNVVKFRGSDHLKDYHSMIINDKGVNILPNLYYQKETKKLKEGIISSGNKEIDLLINGGIETNTNTIVMGPTGVGKTTLSISFLRNAIKDNKKALIYLFEEAEKVLVQRCNGIGIPIDKFIEEGKLIIKNVNSLETNPIEFANVVRSDSQEYDVDLVMLDSITGYYLSYANEYYTKLELVKQLHNLSNYLNNSGITVIMTNEMESITGDFTSSDMGVSYLADNIIFLRYVEMEGKLNKIIGVLKKRLSDFEKTIREFEITSEGLKVGKPLTDFQGILTNNIQIID